MIREWWRHRKALQDDRDSLLVLSTCFALGKTTMYDLWVVTGLPSGRVWNALTTLRLHGAIDGRPRQSDGRFTYWATEVGVTYAKALAAQLSKRHLARKAGVDDA